MKIWILVAKEEFKYYNVCRYQQVALDMGIKLKLVAPMDLDIILTKEGNKSVYYKGAYIDPPDCIITLYGSGSTYFVLAVIRHFENMGVLVLNSSSSIMFARDKLSTLQCLATSNIPIPKTILAKFPIKIEEIEKEFNYPVVIKTVSGSQGKGVFLCEDRQKLRDIMDLIEVSKDPHINIILQEFISTSKGRDLRVLVIGGRAIGVILRTAPEGRFKANYSTGGSVSQFELNPTIEWLAVESAKILKLEIAGIDILFYGDSYMISEVNASPGFKGFEEATKIDVPRIILEYIKFRIGID